MNKLFIALTLASLTIGSIATSAFAEAPSNTQDESGRVYQDIRNGRYDNSQELDESTLQNNDPGHYDGQETVAPVEGCPSDLEDNQVEDDDQNLINRARFYEKQNSGK